MQLLPNNLVIKTIIQVNSTYKGEYTGDKAYVFVHQEETIDEVLQELVKTHGLDNIQSLSASIPYKSYIELIQKSINTNGMVFISDDEIEKLEVVI